MSSVKTSELWISFFEDCYLLLFHVVVDDILLDKDDVLSLPTLDHIQILKSRNDIFRLDSCIYRNILDGDILGWIMKCQQVEKDMRPVAPIRNLSQIRKGLFGRSSRLFSLGQLVRKGNDEFPITLLLMLRKCQYTGKVVLFRRDLHVDRSKDAV